MVKEITVTCAIIEKDGKYLIAKRKGEHFAGLWEFPGGTVEIGETPEQCLERELKEELGIEAKVRGFFEEGFFEDDELKISLLGYRADHMSGEIKLNYHQEARWVAPNEFVRYNFAPADLPIVRELERRAA